VIVRGAAHPEPAGRLGIPSNIGHIGAGSRASARNRARAERGRAGCIRVVRDRLSVFLDVDGVKLLHDRDNAVMPLVVGNVHRYRGPVVVQVARIAGAVVLRHVACEQPIEKAALVTGFAFHMDIRRAGRRTGQPDIDGGQPSAISRSLTRHASSGVFGVTLIGKDAPAPRRVRHYQTANILPHPARPYLF
jgi:hypothetical protein